MSKTPLTISVITPSYKQPDWLRLCAASVADQTGDGLVIEHIVQDSLSGPEVAETLRPFPNARLVSEKDEGMYDAINRGWDKATGDILCWLNCDEQYLPGALAQVADYFCAHPEVDVLCGDTFIIEPDGCYHCSRQVLVPLLYHTWVCHLSTLTCAMFFRREVIKDRGFRLDTRWKSVGDAEFTVRLLRAGVRFGILRGYLALYVETGQNLSAQELGLCEGAKLAHEAPTWALKLRRFWVVLHRVRRLLAGLYSPKPFSADFYTTASPDKRVRLDVSHPTFRWRGRAEWKA